jgi:uroporphyrinogen decarboxylase
MRSCAPHGGEIAAAGLAINNGLYSSRKTVAAPSRDESTDNRKPALTPRQRAIEALELRRPPGPVPTCELAFGLYDEWLGEPIHPPEIPEDATPRRREQIFRAYARDTAEVHRQMGHCIITQWIGREDAIELLGAYRHETGDEFMLGFPADGTFHIPDGTHMEEFVYRLVDEPRAVHEELKRQVDAENEWAERASAGGADVVWMGSDYAMNSGPFLSPEMFAEFVSPYLKHVIEGFRQAGLYVIKHSDGNINPLMDEIVAAKPHALHSLDSVAGVDIRRIKERYGDCIALIGNVPHGPLQLEQRDVIESATRYCLEHGGVRQGGYILSTSNAVFGGDITGIRIEAYRFMLETRGRYTAKLGEGG